MGRISIAVLLSVLLILAASLVAAQSIYTPDYFPVAPRTKWTYLVNGRKTMKICVLNERVTIRGVETAVFLYPGGEKEHYTSDSNGIQLHRIFTPDVPIQGLGDVDISLTFIPPLKMAEAQMVVGQTVNTSGVVRTNSLPYVGVMEFAHDGDFTFEGFDTVTVPAGTFDIARLTGTMTIEGESETDTFDVAEELGIIKLTTTYQGRTGILELISTNAGHVTLLTPNGGEVIPSGLPFDITWNASVDAISFDLFYSLDNGLTWIIIQDGLTGMNYSWIVPNPAGNRRKCLVKVVGYNEAGKKVDEDIPDAPFTIEVIQVTFPTPGETFVSGITYKPGITWETNGTARDVFTTKLFFSKDGGVTWISMAPPLPGNPGSFGWTVPIVKKNKTKCKVKVMLKDSSGNVVGSDVSDGYFTISPVSPPP